MVPAHCTVLRPPTRARRRTTNLPALNSRRRVVAPKHHHRRTLCCYTRVRDNTGATQAFRNSTTPRHTPTDTCSRQHAFSPPPLLPPPSDGAYYLCLHRHRTTHSTRCLPPCLHCLHYSIPLPPFACLFSYLPPHPLSSPHTWTGRPPPAAQHTHWPHCRGMGAPAFFTFPHTHTTGMDPLPLMFTYSLTSNLWLQSSTEDMEENNGRTCWDDGSPTKGQKEGWAAGEEGRGGEGGRREECIHSLL